MPSELTPIHAASLAGLLPVISRLIDRFGLRAGNPARVPCIVGDTGSLLALAICVLDLALAMAGQTVANPTGGCFPHSSERKAATAAIEDWRRTGVPNSRRGWLLQVACGRAIDHFRRQKVLRKRQAELLLLTGESQGRPRPASRTFPTTGWG